MPETPEARLHKVASALAERTRQYEKERDSRCVFTYCYCLLTLELERSIATTPYVDRLWICDLAAAFSSRYFDALDRYDAHDPDLPLAWQEVFAVTQRRFTSVVEDLVFGMTAHIVADLPHALAKVGLADSAGRTRIADYHVVNDILGNSIDLIRTRVAHRYAQRLARIDHLGGGHAIVVTNFGIRMARAVAWYNAVRLQHPEIAPIAAQSIQKSAVAVVNEIAHPPFWSIRMLMRIWRVFIALFRRWPESLPIEVNPIP